MKLLLSLCIAHLYCSFFLCSLHALAFEKPELEYVSESFGRSFEVSTSNRIRLTSEKPIGLTVDIENLIGQKIGYGQFDFGSTDGGQVALLTVTASGEESDDIFRLFVDSNRDRKIETNEEVRGIGDTKVLELPTNIDSKTNRWVRLRKSKISESISIQTMGGMSGVCAIAGKKINVRRIDGDGNGRFADPRDQIWLDLNGDGKWNTITERFPFQLALRLEAQRYLVRGNTKGNKFSLEPIDGEGILNVALDLTDQDSVIKEFGMTLFGDDGASFRIQTLKNKKLPVGRYRVGSVSLLMKNENESKPWYFAFTHSGRDGEGDWFEINKDENTKLDPLGKLEFKLTGEEEYSLDSTITVRPFLVTESRLYLRESGREKPDRFGEVTGNPAAITALNGLGQIIDQTTSGFQ